MRPRGLSTLTVGLITVVVVVVGTYLGFTKDIPFTKPFEIKAVFESANSIRNNSPVRIAGVQVGKVQSVTAQDGSDTAVVTMAINPKGLPIHADATAKIRPRIFLEGNFFVELTTGTPQAPELGSGDTIKVTQTSSPVQLDQVLTAFQGDTREDLKTIIGQVGTALSDKPTKAQDARADASVQGKTGAQAFNEAYDDLGVAQRDTSIVNEALLGSEPDKDLQRLIGGLAGATEGLDRNERQLQDLVTNLSTTMGGFAREQGNLRTSIRLLGPTLQTANATFTSLNAAFPAIRGFSRDILPGVRETPGVIKAGFPWIAQTRKLVQPAELRGLAKDLSPASRDLARLVNTSTRVFPQADNLAKCFTNVVLPTGDVVIKDQFENGQPNYREFAYALVGLSGEGQNFDGNGQYVRFQPGGGPTTVSLGNLTPASGSVLGNAFPGLGTQPATPKNKPAYNASTPCYKSKLPDLNGPWARKGSFGTVQSGSNANRLTSGQRKQLKAAELQALRPSLRPFGSKAAKQPADAKAKRGTKG